MTGKIKVIEKRQSDNPLQEFQDILKEAIHVLDYPDQVFDFLKVPMRFLEVSIPIQMDNGETRMFQGYRAQHNDAAGPTKGGFGFTRMSLLKKLRHWPDG